MTVKPFCLRCGWNVQKNLLYDERVRKHLPWFWPAFLLLFIFWGTHDGWGVAIFSCGFIGFIVGSVHIQVLKDLKRLSAFQSSTGGAAQATTVPTDSGARTVFPAARPPSAKEELLLSIPRPRPVRLKLGSKIGYGMGIGLSAGFVWLGVQGLRGHPLFPRLNLPWSLVSILAALFSSYKIWQMWQRDKVYRRLLVEGEVKIARVVSQFMAKSDAKSGKDNVVRYEFELPSGEMFTGECFDYAAAYYEDMTLPVFYDPIEGKAVGICGCSYEVIL